MRTLVTTLMVSALALGGYTAAHAADAVEQIPQPPVAQEAPPAVNNWSGFYIGGAGDWNAGHFNRNGDAYAWGGQAFTGYNWQQGQIVYGVEADLGYSGADSTRNGLTAKNGVNGSVRGRIGYDFNPFMLYGTAGTSSPTTPRLTARRLLVTRSVQVLKPSSPTTSPPVSNTATRTTARNTSTLTPAASRAVTTSRASRSVSASSSDHSRALA